MIKRFLLIILLLFVSSNCFAYEVTYEFTDGNSGRVYKQGINYSANTGWNYCQCGRNPSITAEWRAMFQFDTSKLPNTLDVTKVEIYIIEALTQPDNEPLTMSMYIGDFIGTSLDGTQAEFEGGTIMRTDDSYTSGTWYDLSDDGQDPTGYVNLTGTTDIKIKDDSTARLQTGRNFNQLKNECKLRVTGTIDRVIVID